MKKIILTVFTAILASSPVFAAAWMNDLRDVFVTNKAIILEVNIRTFNAQDKNGNDIIEADKGEVSGNFVNAISRLDELKDSGINTIHLLPITPVGKIKAIGTAGSLYAISSFTELNPQLDDPNNNLTVMQEAKQFVKECHKRNIRVIVDLPSCGSYDMYLAHPNWFLQDKDGNPIVPADWTDVRLFKVQNADGSLNSEVYGLFRDYVDMVMKLNVDGIRADVASSKPAEFWSQLIKYAKAKDPQFLFLAEASDSWHDAVAKGAPFTSYDKLLEAGFDGFYGSFMNYKDWKTAQPLEEHIQLIKSLKNKYSEPKAVIGSFATHDELSPIVTGRDAYATQILWLQSTLPVNSYFVDGFQTGDNYMYRYANQKAAKTYTDDDYYYVHKGKTDIFNFSRRPGGTNEQLKDEFVMANGFKLAANRFINDGSLCFLKTSNPSIIAYSLTLNRSTIIVILNKNLTFNTAGTVSMKGIGPDMMVVPVRVPSSPKIKKNEIQVDLPPAGIIVLTMDNSIHMDEILKKNQKKSAK